MKFKPGDKVVWFFDGKMEPPETVVSEEQAYELYSQKDKDGSFSGNALREWMGSQERKEEKPVYIVNSDGDIGWMPEDELYECTTAMEVLYGKTNHNLSWFARIRKKYNV